MADEASEATEGTAPEDIWGTLGLHPAGEPGWVITWTLSPPDWATVRHPGMPAGLRLRVKVTPGAGGAVTGVLIERVDGRPVSEADLRAVKLPPARMLAAGPLPPPSAEQAKSVD